MTENTKIEKEMKEITQEQYEESEGKKRGKNTISSEQYVSANHNRYLHT